MAAANGARGKAGPKKTEIARRLRRAARRELQREVEREERLDEELNEHWYELGMHYHPDGDPWGRDSD